MYNLCQFAKLKPQARLRTYATKVIMDKFIHNITFGDVKKRNALSLATLEDLESKLMAVNPKLRDFSPNLSHPESSLENVNQDVRCVIISSHGNVFSAGHDLKELLANRENPDMLKKIFKKCSDVMLLIRKMPQPVIAMVEDNQIATAAGCQLVAASDLAVAGSGSTFATPGSSIGLFCTTPSVPLSSTSSGIPTKVAMKMLLTAQPISAEEALTHGIISHLTTGNVHEETMRVATEVCSGSPKAILLGKWAFYQNNGHELEKTYRFSEKVMVANLALNQSGQGIGGFVSKKPVDGLSWEK
jgi:enoyl-CoA hydratase/carnithine racemase